MYECAFCPCGVEERRRDGMSFLHGSDHVVLEWHGFHVPSHPRTAGVCFSDPPQTNQFAPQPPASDISLCLELPVAGPRGRLLLVVRPSFPKLSSPVASAVEILSPGSVLLSLVTLNKSPCLYFPICEVGVATAHFLLQLLGLLWRFHT